MSGATTVDFSDDFVVTESPSGEGNVDLATSHAGSSHAAVQAAAEATAALALTTHNGLDTGVHGAGASTLATEADIATHAGAADPHTPYLLAAGTRLANYLGIGAAAAPSASNLLAVSTTHVSPAGSLTGFGYYLDSDIEHGPSAGAITRNHIGAYVVPGLDIDGSPGTTTLNGEQTALESGWVVNFGDVDVIIDQATAWKPLLALLGSAGVLNTARTIHVVDALVTAGSIGTQYGIDIAALSAAALNVGIRNLSTSRLVAAVTLGSDAAAAGSALLDMVSTTQGLLVPRMTTVQRGAIGTPATGLWLFDTDIGRFFYYTGAAWKRIITEDDTAIFVPQALADALGDLFYASADNTFAKLAGNTTTTKKFLTQTGDGAASAAPAWGVPDASDVTYTPAVLTDWDADADPGDVDNALDQLAERVDDVEGAAGHAAVTVAADLSPLISLSTQELSFAVQNANKVLAGPAAGGDADPTMRALVAADIPDVSTTYVPKSLFDAQSILAATADNTPAAVTVAEQTVVGRVTGGNIDDLTIGIADDNIVQIDHAPYAAATEYARFTANGLESRSKAETQADLDLEAGTDFPSLATFNDHSARHEDGGGDEISLAGLVGDTRRLVIVIDGGGSEIADGAKIHIPDMPAATVAAWTIAGDVSGSIVLDVWNDTYANSPPTVADTMIATGTKPTLSTAQFAQDTTVDWADVTIAAGSTLTVNCDSCTTITRVTLTLRLTMT